MKPAPLTSRIPRYAIGTSRPSALRLKGGAVIAFPAVMGVLNVTPDSFSDGGRYFDRDRAIAHALEMHRDGADIIDIGGESTRPGAREVSAQEEMDRVIPVIEALRARAEVPISIDTRKSAVAAAALDAGAAIVNDVSGLQFDPATAAVASEAGAALVIMHMRGTPESMNRLARYRDVVAEVSAFLKSQATKAERAGMKPSRIILDPGIGFAKNADHNLRLLYNLPRICSLGYPVLVGVSRKRFVRAISGDSPEQVSFGTAAASAIAVLGGASIVRVHEPAANRAALRMAVAVARGRIPIR